MSFYIRNDVAHFQNRLVCRYIELCRIWENDNAINGDIVTKDKSAKSFDMPFILPNGISQLMFLSKSILSIAGVWQILLPELGIATAIYFAMNVLCLQYEHSAAANDDVVYLASVLAVTDEKVIENVILFIRQI